MTPEQYEEHAISERIAALWARWYESGDGDLGELPTPRRLRGCALWVTACGERVVIPLTRDDVRWLAGQIRAEVSDAT